MDRTELSASWNVVTSDNATDDYYNASVLHRHLDNSGGPKMRKRSQQSEEIRKHIYRRRLKELGVTFSDSLYRSMTYADIRNAFVFVVIVKNRIGD